jgi:hypothetical protein
MNYQAMKRHEGTLLSERSQSKETVYYMVPTLWYSGKGRTMKTVERLSG